MRTLPILPDIPTWFPCWNSVNLADLESQLRDLADKGNAIMAEADNEGRALTPAEATEIDALSQKFQLIEARLNGHEAAQRSLTRMSAGSQSQGRKTTAEGPDTDYRVDAPRGGKRESGLALDGAHLRRLQNAAPFAGRHYQELYGKPTEKNPFPDMDEFLDIIVNNRFDPRLVRAAAMSEGNESQGGYLVPPDFAMTMLDNALEQSVLWGRTRVEPMVSKTKEIGTFDSDNGTTPFGLTMQWKAEGANWNEQSAKTRNILLTSAVAGVYVPVSNELFEDGGKSFASLLETALTSAIAFGVDSAIISGNGAGQPLGILNSNSLISVPKSAGQLADTLGYENIVTMFSRLSPACVKNAIWLANPSTLPQLLQMSLGLGANGFYPALNEGSGGYSLLGRPLFLTEKASALGDKGDIILVDGSQYVVGLRRDITVALSQHVKFVSDQIVVKVSIRLAGQPTWQNAWTPKNGVTTSWAVTLDAR